MTKSSAKTKSGKAKQAAGEGSGEGAGSLDIYRQKRDPAHTNEPFSAERIPSARGGNVGAFVVHLHDARRRHWDLRLQVGGTLKSFAVPKGPTFDTREKRLAVHTEDHPLEYVDFEEVIPEGSYGAGAMIAWDLGRVNFLEPAIEGFKKGKLDFVLMGFKLRGRFALVRTGDRAGRAPDEKNQWLLIKKEDAFSSTTRDVIKEEPESVLSGLTVEQLLRKREVASAIEERAKNLGAPERDVDTRRLVPMLCGTGDARLDDPERLYELKLDGVRLLAERHGGDVALVYRSQRVMTASYPEVARAVRALSPDRLVLDGEVVAFDAEGRPSFQLLGRRMHLTRPHDVAHAASEVPVTYVVFDLLQVGARDLRNVPLAERKALLSEIVPHRGIVRFLDHLEGDGKPLEALCGTLGLEGIVAKRLRSHYRPGPERSLDWLKIKREREADFVVSGYTEGSGGRSSFGALEVASYVDGRLVLRSRVGSGLDAATIKKLMAELRSLEVAEPTAVGEPMPGGGKRHFVRPEIVVNVGFAGWTEGEGLRHPVFRGIRDDVDAKSCVAAPKARRAESELLDAPEPSVSGPDEGNDSAPPHAVAVRPSRAAVTNRAKVFWPDEGYTKGELVDYYAAIAPFILPFLRDRPIVLVRYPDGIKGKSFYQWNAPEGTPSWIRTFHLPEDDDPDDRETPDRRGKRDKPGKTTFIVDDVDGLVHVANLGCIPIHVLPYRSTTPRESDYFVVDFDIGSRSFSDAVTLALTLRELLTDVGLTGFPKTSGQSGLHVLVPMGPGVSFDTSKMLVEVVGKLLQAKHRELSTTERRVNQRGDRVFIDTGQTGRSRTIVAPYSVRAHPGATVSTPLRWEDLHRALEPRELSMFTVPARARERGEPLSGFFEVRPDVPRVVAGLGKKLGL